MTDDEDRELLRRFAAQKREEFQAAPPFRRMWAAARVRRRPRPGARFTVAAVTLAILGLLWLRPESRPAPDSEASPPIARWRSPTAFLLATPGRELLTTVPPLGGPAIPGLALPVPPPKPPTTPKGQTS